MKKPLPKPTPKAVRHPELLAKKPSNAVRKGARLEEVRLTLDEAAKYFQRSRKTVEIQLGAIGCRVERGSTFAAPDVIRAVVNAYAQARTRIAEGNAAAIERENKRKAGQLYDAAEADAFHGEVFRAFFGDGERIFLEELPPLLVGLKAEEIAVRAAQAFGELKASFRAALDKWEAGQKKGGAEKQVA